MERDEESGLNYHGARYYAAWLGRWTSCDPKESASNSLPVKNGLGDARSLSTTLGQRDSHDPAANAHGQNVYLYCLNNPIGFIDLNGQETSKWDYFKFYIWHPTLAPAIGVPEGRGYSGSGSGEVKFPTLRPNISTLAMRFSDLGLEENKAQLHSETNALRHAVWQGFITRDFSAEDAKLVGDFHEDNPTKDLNVRHFENPTGTKEGNRSVRLEADETIDLLNNERARNFYNWIQDKTNKGIAQYYLRVFRDKGFYVADITYKDSAHTVIDKIDIKLHHLDDPTYERAMRKLNDLSEVGLTQDQQKATEAHEAAEAKLRQLRLRH